MQNFTTYELACLQEKIGDRLTPEERKALDAMFLDNTLVIVDTILMLIKNNIPVSSAGVIPSVYNFHKEANKKIEEIVSKFLK